MALFRSSANNKIGGGKTGSRTERPLAARIGRRLFRYAALFLVLAVLLPPVLTVLYAAVPPVSTLMLSRYVQFLWVDRQWVPIGEISPRLVKAVITSEDANYCRHHGVEWEALQKQIELLSEGESPRGASTITMQTAKNLYLWHGRSFVRKGMEIPLAVMLDGILTKRRVLEIYLNIAEWGEGIFGAEAAAQAWFGKPASDLTRTEAARLATALPNPLARNPANPTSGHRRLSATNVARVKAAGPIFGCVLSD